MRMPPFEWSWKRWSPVSVASTAPSQRTPISPSGGSDGWMRRFGCFVAPGTAIAIAGSTRVATSVSKPAPA